MVDIEAYLLSNLWLPVLLWIVLYVGDYYLTIWGARLHRAGAREHIAFEGSYELTPQFQQDINGLRWFSRRFLGYVLLSVAVVAALWIVARLWPRLEAVFLLVYGGLLFRQLAVLARHARNIVLFRRLCAHDGVQGSIRYSQWLSLEVSYVELLATGLLLLAAAAVAWRLSILGGALALCTTALEHRKLSRKHMRSASGAERGDRNGNAQDGEARPQS